MRRWILGSQTKVDSTKISTPLEKDKKILYFILVDNRIFPGGSNDREDEEKIAKCVVTVFSEVFEKREKIYFLPQF